MTFPDTPLDLRTELLLNGAWTDVSAYTEHGAVVTSRGHPDESTAVSASTAAVTLTNSDARFTSRNPAGPYYPYLMRNVQARISVPAQSGYMRIETGTASYAQTPTSAPLQITGDTDIRLDFKPSSYAFAALAGKNSGGTGPSWLWELLQDQTLRFFWWDSGGAGHSVQSPVPIGAGRVTLRVTLAVADGTVTFWTGPALSGPFTQLAAGASGSGGAATTVFSGTAPLRIGDSSSACYGSYYGFWLLNGIGGTTVASPDFTAPAAGTTVFADAQSNTWTLNGAAEISDRNYRGHFEVPEWPQRQDQSGKTVTVAASGGGLLRRLSQRNNPVNSAMYRAWTRVTGSVLAGYWPMEDGADASSLGSGIGGQPMYFGGDAAPQPAANSDFACSDALPVINGAVLSAVPGAATWTDNQAAWLMEVPAAGELNGSAIVTVTTNGTIRTLTLSYGTGGAMTVQGFNAAGTQLFSTTASFGLNGAQVLAELGLQNAGGGNLTWSVQTLVPGASSAGAISGTVAGTIGAVTRVQFNPFGGQGLTQTVFGHAAVLTQWQSLFALDSYTSPYGLVTGALTAWAGEPAGVRFKRLCAEEGVSVRIRGNLNSTVLMGAQVPQTATALLQECTDADRGIWYEPRQALGFGYITRSALYNQAAQVTVDYSQDHLSMWPSDPREDDQVIVNDATVSQSSGGSSVRQFAAPGQPVTGGRLSTLSPPAGAGTYDQQYTLNLYAAADLDSEASWIVHTGTVDQPRFPGILLDLSNRDLAPLYWPILDMDIGDRLVISSPPAWLGPDPVSQLAAQLTETLFTKQLEIAVCGIPELPYEVAADGAGYHVDTGGTSLAVPAGSADTTLTVTTAAGPAWTASAGDFPFDVGAGGERCTVTGVATAPTPLCRVGAFLNDAAYGAADFTAAYTAWQSLTGLTIGVSRAYYGPSDFGVPLRTDIAEMIAAGVKICIDLQPSCSPLSATDLANMTTFLQALKTAGAEADISLWHEPFFGGLTAAQYQAVYAYYGPVIRQYYPLVVCLSGDTDTNPANGYYPAAGAYDKIAVDAYAGSATTQVTNAEAAARAYGKPFGIWEFGGATDSVNGQSQTAVTTFFTFIQSLMTSRAAAGLPNADMILFSSGNVNWLGTGLSQAAGFEGGIANWQNSSNCTVAPGTVAHSGTGSLKMTANAAGSMLARHCNSTLAALTAHAMPVTAGQIIAVSAWFRAAVTPRNCQVPIIITDAAGAVLSTTFGAAVADTTTGFTQVNNNVTAPAAAAWAVVETEVVSAALGEVHFADDVYLAVIPSANDLAQAIQFSFDYRIALLSSMQTALNNTSYPQVMTVTRSVNGISKAQSAGTAVAMWNTPVAAL